MKSRYVLLYDEHCPLCRWYTQLFVRTGLLAPGGRQTLRDWEARDPVLYPNPHRAMHEIPLLDLQAGEVYYGIDALLALLGQWVPWLPRLGQFPPLHAALRTLYAFISYNRRILAGGHPCEGACTPDFHAGWRYVWLGFAALISVLITVAAGDAAGGAWLGRALAPPESLLITGSGWLLFLLLTLQLPYRMRMDYLGQLATVSFVGVLLLLPALLLDGWLPAAAPWLWAGAIALSFGTMYRMLLRRTRVSLLPAWYHLSWALLLLLTAPLSTWLLLY